MTSTTTGTGTDQPAQLPEERVEPQPLDSSIATGQVEIEDPQPSEEKDAIRNTVVDLSKEEAIEDRTRPTIPIDEDWEVTAFEGEKEREKAAEKEDKKQERPLKKFSEREKIYLRKPTPSNQRDLWSSTPHPPTPSNSILLYPWHKRHI
jgi:hypothetical protein